MEKQTTIFEVLESKETEYYQLRDLLSKYEIDQYYDKNIKSKGMLLRQISEQLKKQKDYKEYYEDLIVELKKIFPTLTWEESILPTRIGLIETEYGYRWRSKTMSSPLYCLSQIKESFF